MSSRLVWSVRVLSALSLYRYFKEGEMWQLIGKGLGVILKEGESG